jgi:hypothetical protein
LIDNSYHFAIDLLALQAVLTYIIGQALPVLLDSGIRQHTLRFVLTGTHPTANQFDHFVP